MAKIANWSDDYWLLLLQAYLQKPEGVKPIYSKVLVDLGMELHIHPAKLHAKMEEIATRPTPLLQRLWDNYDGNTRRLQKAVRQLHKMKGFGCGDLFYNGVTVKETFEKDFRPIEADNRIMPVTLILILNLYFQLTPATMVAATPEVIDLARLVKLKPIDIETILVVFQHCDPYLNRQDPMISPFFGPCKDVWQRFSTESPESLETLASELSDYFKS